MIEIEREVESAGIHRWWICCGWHFCLCCSPIGVDVRNILQDLEVVKLRLKTRFRIQVKCLNRTAD